MGERRDRAEPARSPAGPTAYPLVVAGHF